MFPFLTAFMIFIIVTTVLRSRATRSERERTAAFWKRESEANNTRRADLSAIPGYTFNISELPEIRDDAELAEYYDRIAALSKEKMMNLNGLSNTDLKLSYGPQNLEQLTIYGDNYSALENAILAYGKLLLEKGKRKEAVSVLEKGITMPTDLTENYILLGNIYREENSPHRIEGLKTMADKNLSGYTRDTVLRVLEDNTLNSGGAKIS